MEFPCLLISEDTGNIIIATGTSKKDRVSLVGTLIKVGEDSHANYCIGEYANDWARGCFKEYKQVVAVHI